MCYSDVNYRLQYEKHLPETLHKPRTWKTKLNSMVSTFSLRRQKRLVCGNETTATPADTLTDNST